MSFSKWAILAVLLLLCIAGAMLFYVSLSPKVNGINLKEFAASRNEKTKTLYASRGTIYTSNGDALALSVNSYTLIAYLEPSRTTDENHPEHVVDKEMTARKISEFLGMEYETVLGYLNKQAYQVEFGAKGKNLTEIEKKQIEELELPGIGFIESTQRYYKMGNFSSYIVGYAKTNDEGDITGELGIEGYFDKMLSGTDGKRTYQSDAYGYQLPNKPYVEEPAVSGSDIYLTIDSNIQLICENALHDLSEEKEMDWGIVTITDAKTGAIVASATNPNFNPNDLNTIESYLNPLVSEAYEPGSTMKIFSWAASMEEGLYKGQNTYKSGSIEVADVKINDWNKKGWGTITYDYGFAMSSNVGATNLGLELGRERLYNYYTKFGYGEKTGIELSSEVAGKIAFKYPSEIANASFGQGILVTPVQMIQALTSITNDGVMLKPYIVEKIVDDKGNITYKGERTEVGRVMKSSTVKDMKKLLYNANYDGVSKMWQPKTVTMIAKTGTAQIANPKGGGYLDGQYDTIYSVAGMFPEEEPRYIIYLAVKRIIGSQKNVADMAVDIVDEIAAYANITGDSNHIETTNIITVENYKSKKTLDVVDTLKAEGLNPIVLGTGEYVINEYPSVGTKLVEGSKIIIVTNREDYVMPDMTGWSISDVKTYAAYTGLNLNYTGYGYVKTQSIEAGKPIEKGTLLQLELKNK